MFGFQEHKLIYFTSLDGKEEIHFEELPLYVLHKYNKPLLKI